MRDLMSFKVSNFSRKKNTHTCTDIEFINTEDRFTNVRDALKTLNKMDFDKLIVSVWTLPSIKSILSYLM